MSFSHVSSTADACFDLWNGSSNNAPPSGWMNQVFNDDDWPLAVVADTHGNTYGSGTSPIWPQDEPQGLTQSALFRSHFNAPTGMINATLLIGADNNVNEVYINSHVLAIPESGSPGYGVPVSFFNEGVENTIAIRASNAGTVSLGAAYLWYQLIINTWEEDGGTTDGADVATRTNYGSFLGTTEDSTAAVRLKHSDGRVDWEHDGTLFRVRSGNKTAVQVPFPPHVGTPDTVLGKEPTTGIPMWYGLADYVTHSQLPVDTGGQGQLPVPDSTLPDDPPAPTTLQTDKLLPPAEVPDPIIDNCPIMRCGAAYYLAQKLKEQYDIVRNCLLGMLAAPFLIRVPIVAGDFGIPIIDLIIANLSNELIGQFGADILWLTRLMTKLSRWMKIAGVSFSVARDFEDIHEEGITILQRLAYPCLTCSENIFNLSQDMLIAWELAINADTADFTDWQRHLLVYILQCTPFGIYHTVAAQGAAITSDTCGGF